MKNSVKVGALRIASAGTTSALLSSLKGYKSVTAFVTELTVHVGALTSANVAVQVSDTENGTFRALQVVPGTDLVILPNKAVKVDASGFRDLRFVAAGAEGADRDIVVFAKLEP